MALSHDAYLLSGPGGPEDDDLPVACQRCGGCGYVTEYMMTPVFVRCYVCRGEGMIDKPIKETENELEQTD